MGEGAGQGGWRRAVDSRLGKLQQQDGRLGQLALLWAAALSVVVVSCTVFFLAIYWILG